MALHDNLAVTWTYQDVYNKFAPSPEENLYYNATTDADGCLEKVFWVLKGALGLWAENEECNPIIYDTSHRTNKYTLKFSGFTTVDGTVEQLSSLARY